MRLKFARRFCKGFVYDADLIFRLKMLDDTVSDQGKETSPKRVVLFFLFAGVIATIFPIRSIIVDNIFPILVNQIIPMRSNPTSHAPQLVRLEEREGDSPSDQFLKSRLDIKEMLGNWAAFYCVYQSKKSFWFGACINQKTTPGEIRDMAKKAQSIYLTAKERAASNLKPSSNAYSSEPIEPLKKAPFAPKPKFNYRRWRRDADFYLLDAIMQRGWYQLRTGNYQYFPLEEFYLY